jgi:hypothetical protein
MVDFDQNGSRRSIQLKILDLSDNGLVEVGIWTNTNRLNITSVGVQQMAAIRKHLQVVTREVMGRSFEIFKFYVWFILRKNLMLYGKYMRMVQFISKDIVR